jgi:hypothetical protein
MKSRSTCLFGLALALVLATAGTGRADPVVWWSSWSTSPNEVPADIGSGKIVLTQDPTPVRHTNTSYVTATNISTSSTATDANPAFFTHQDFSLFLTIYDGDAPTPARAQLLPAHTFEFAGYFHGPLTATNDLVDAIIPDLTPQSFKIGSNLYTVTFVSYTPPDVTLANQDGAISVKVEVGVQSIRTVPEPGTLLLSVLGLAFVAVPWRRGRCATSRGEDGLASRPPGATSTPPTVGCHR